MTVAAAAFRGTRRRGRRPAGGRRWRRGLTLFGALLAVGLLGIMMAGVAAWGQQRALERRGEVAAAELAVLADAVAAFVQGDLPAALAVAPGEIALATLRAAGSLPPGFAERSALGRSWRVLVLGAGARAIDVVATEDLGAGDPSAPPAAVLAAAGTVRLGIVGADAPTRLRGLALDADVSAFQAAFAGAPRAGALASLERFDADTVYGDQLFRGAVPGFPELNRMAADLDMDGFDIADADNVAADAMTLEADLDVGGDLTVVGDLVVGRATTVAGAVTVSAGLEAQSATVAGAVDADTMTVTGLLDAASVDAAGAVTAGSVGVTGAATAASATVGTLGAASVTARSVTAASAAAADVSAGQVVVTNRIDADDAGISRLTVGVCTGC